MTRDPLSQLLSRADAEAGRPVGPSLGLAGRVRAEARRRARVRATYTAAAVLLVAAAMAIPIVRHSLRPQVTNVAVVRPGPMRDGREVARLQNEIAALREQADSREAAVAVMIQGEARGRRAPARALADPQERIRDQQELAALALVRQADRLYRELDRKRSATATYQRVVALFPQTPWATVARQRLVEIKG